MGRTTLACADPMGIGMDCWDHSLGGGRGCPGAGGSYQSFQALISMHCGWYLRVRLDLDVVLGDEALAAIQLSLVPVLVIFHVEDLRWDRSREALALGEGLSGTPLTAPDPTFPT